MSGDLLLRAADAMVAEAATLRALAEAATGGCWEVGRSDDDTDVPLIAADGHAWEYLCCSPDDGVRGGHSLADADLIAHRRNTLARDAATLRALADLIRNDADAGYEQREVVAIARAFLGEVTP